jgi:hypothetical protein
MRGCVMRVLRGLMAEERRNQDFKCVVSEFVYD